MSEVNQYPAQPALMPNRILRIKDVITKTGLSRSHLYSIAKSGDFPRSVSLIPGGTSVGWVESEIDSWIEQRIQARGQGVNHV